MNCIIISNRVNSNPLKRLVESCSSLNFTGMYTDLPSALSLLITKRHNIDLGIIDLDIADLDRFDEINNLNNPPYFIAFASNGQYAIKAFDYNFIDYLLKPVSYSKFFRAINKVINCNKNKEINANGNHEIFINKDLSLAKLNMKDITYIEALENYIILNTVDTKYTLLFTMKGIENQLPPEIFKRIHRSFIVNKRAIKIINDDNLQISTGGTVKNLPIGRSFRDSLLSDISIMTRA